MADLSNLGTTGIGIYSTYHAAALLRRVLGPPADALGRRLARAVDPDHAERTMLVLENAARKLPGEEEEGEMNPRVLGRVVDEVEWADDHVLVDYLGGILASAKTPAGRDDRGVMWTRVVGGLATYSLRLHYVIYTIARQMYPGRVQSITDGDKLHSGRLCIPHRLIVQAMDFSEVEAPSANGIYSHAVFALASEDMIHQDFVFGSTEMLVANQVPYATEPGITLTVTPRGAELYMWAHGHGSKHVNEFLNPELTFEYPPEILIPEGAQFVTDMRAIEAMSSDVTEGPLRA